MEKQKEIEKYLLCVLCNQKFNKTNKPLIMFCGHNICEDCRLKYYKKIKCETCGKVFSKREIKKFPINYSILENKLLSSSETNKSTNNIDDKNNIEELKNLSPQTCINFVTAFMSEVSKYMAKSDNNQIKTTNDNSNNTDNINAQDNQDKKDKQDKEINQCKEIIKERDLIIKETFDLIELLENNFVNYSNMLFDSMISLFKTNKDQITKDLNICQLLEESGIINYGDYVKLKKFLDIIENINEEKLNNCTSFDDIYELVKEKKNEITYEQFISLFFFFNKIFELKIKRIPKILEEQKKMYSNKKENTSNLIHLLTNLAKKYEITLSDIFYDITIYKSGYFIYDINKNENIKTSLINFYNKNEDLFHEYNNIILFYEPIKKKLNIQIIKSKDLKNENIIDSYIILNQFLYILTDKKLYIYELNSEKTSFINTIPNQEIEKHTKIFKYDTSIMKISSNFFESINLRNDISKNEWRTMSLFENTPGVIKRPYPICHSSNYIYVLDQEEKNINNIYIYNEDSDFWEKKELKLEVKPKDEEKEKEKDKGNDKEKEKNNENNNEKENEKINKTNNNIDLNKEKEELIIVKQLYLEDYYFFNKCFACIFGGRHPVTKKFNKNVYMIDAIKGIIKKIIDFNDYISDDMIIINFNCGILNKYIDFIFIYYLINEENNIKVKIIRKEIIDNDISINNKFNIIMDINISDIPN